MSAAILTPMRVRVRFTGRVQGVGFRVTTHGIARRVGVSGWVRNEEDGSVLAEIEGPPDAVQRMLGEIRSVFSRNLVGGDEAVIDELGILDHFEVRR